MCALPGAAFPAVSSEMLGSINLSLRMSSRSCAVRKRGVKTHVPVAALILNYPSVMGSS